MNIDKITVAKVYLWLSIINIASTLLTLIILVCTLLLGANQLALTVSVFCLTVMEFLTTAPFGPLPLTPAMLLIYFFFFCGFLLLVFSWRDPKARKFILIGLGLTIVYGYFLSGLIANSTLRVQDVLGTLH